LPQALLTPSQRTCPSISVIRSAGSGNRKSPEHQRRQYVPAGLAVILLHGAAVDVITPANTVQLRDPVMGNFLSSAL